MNKDLLRLIERMFADLNTQSAAGALPAPGTLSDVLSRYVVESSPNSTVPAQQKVLTYFATAAVEMWLRSVHSFLISLSLTKASPIWASVAGYYSSHYSVRAFAHLFGVFHLHKKKRIVRLEKDGNRLVFRIEKKQGHDREHKFYWKCVSEHPQLSTDPFFYPSQEGVPKSDSAHRNKANYSDHVDRFPVFLPLDAQFLRDRIERISTISFSNVPVPSADDFPDLDSVQIVAYHRFVKFRVLVDEALGSQNRFWKVQRNPVWRPDNMNFSVVDAVFTALYAGK
jgi:hypothetical protein